MDSEIRCPSNSNRELTRDSVYKRQMYVHTFEIVHLHTVQLLNVRQFHRRLYSIVHRPEHFWTLEEQSVQRLQPEFGSCPFLNPHQK